MLRQSRKDPRRPTAEGNHGANESNVGRMGRVGAEVSLPDGDPVG